MIPCARCGDGLDGIETMTAEAWRMTGLFFCDACAEDIAEDDGDDGE